MHQHLVEDLKLHALPRTGTRALQAAQQPVAQGNHDPLAWVPIGQNNWKQELHKVPHGNRRQDAYVVTPRPPLVEGNCGRHRGRPKQPGPSDQSAVASNTDHEVEAPRHVLPRLERLHKILAVFEAGRDAVFQGHHHAEGVQPVDHLLYRCYNLPVALMGNYQHVPRPAFGPLPLDDLQLVGVGLHHPHPFGPIDVTILARGLGSIGKGPLSSP
mmetsp:Transcript_67280/g.179415  ORF Transcript_67280/g.179415 Transcript_67280/m.179415 type:complete len:214 (+) Transcript_67280:559-1200(+)